MTITTYRCCERDRYAASQVIPSHSAKSHDFFDAHGGIYSINVFPSVYVHFFLPDKKFILLKCAHKFFMRIFRIYAHLGICIQRFFMRYSKMRIKISYSRGWKRCYWFNGKNKKRWSLVLGALYLHCNFCNHLSEWKLNWTVRRVELCVETPC